MSRKIFHNIFTIAVGFITVVVECAIIYAIGILLSKLGVYIFGIKGSSLPIILVILICAGNIFKGIGEFLTE